MRYIIDMSSRGLVFASLLVVGAAWVACADFSSNDAPGADAGADAPGAGSDASAPPGDAGGGSSDGGTSGCARFADASFCVDFEQPDPLAATVWTAPQTSIDAGTIALTTARSVSPTHAVSFLMRDGGPPCDSLVLERSFSGAYRNVRARASASVEASGYFFVLSSHPDNNISYVLLVVMREASIDLDVEENSDGGPYTKGRASIPFDTTPFGTFQDVMVEIDTASHTARLTVGARSEVATLPPEYTTKNPRLTLGPFCHNTDQRVLIDDVAAWVTP